MKNKFSLLLFVAAAICLGIAFLLVFYQSQRPRVICEVVWKKRAPETATIFNSLWPKPRQVLSDALRLHGVLPDCTEELVRDSEGKEAFKLAWKGTTSLGAGIVLLHPPMLTTSANYALIGELRHENVGSHLRIEMTFVSFSFSGRPPYFGTFSGHTNVEAAHNSDWQSFTLLVDPSKVNLKFPAFNVNLSLGGPDTVYLRNIKFVAYRSGTNPTIATAPWSGLAQAIVMCICGAFALVVAGTGGVLFLAQHRRHLRQRELRRIASLDE